MEQEVAQGDHVGFLPQEMILCFLNNSLFLWRKQQIQGSSLIFKILDKLVTVVLIGILI